MDTMNGRCQFGNLGVHGKIGLTLKITHTDAEDVKCILLDRCRIQY